MVVGTNKREKILWRKIGKIGGGRAEKSKVRRWKRSEDGKLIQISRQDACVPEYKRRGEGGVAMSRWSLSHYWSDAGINS